MGGWQAQQGSRLEGQKAELGGLIGEERAQQSRGVGPAGRIIDACQAGVQTPLLSGLLPLLSLFKVGEVRHTQKSTAHPLNQSPVCPPPGQGGEQCGPLRPGAPRHPRPFAACPCDTALPLWPLHG